jgi:hypothetical protein
MRRYRPGSAKSELHGEKEGCRESERRLALLAIHADAVETERMIRQLKMFLVCYFVLAALDELVAEFFDSAALDAYDVIVMLAAV